MADARISQVVVETLILPPPPAARLTQVVVELLGATVASLPAERVTLFLVVPV